MRNPSRLAVRAAVWLSQRPYRGKISWDADREAFTVVVRGRTLPLTYTEDEVVFRARTLGWKGMGGKYLCL